MKKLFAKVNWLMMVKLGALPSLLGMCLIHSATSQRPARRPYASDQPLKEPTIFGAGVISTGDDESHPAFMPDGRTLYFLKNTPDFSHWTIVVSRFERGRWGEPEVAPFSGQYSDADPFITPDGQRFFFISTRPVDGNRKEDNDIWMMEKNGAGWGSPQHLGPTINSEANEWFPTVADNGALYFGSERPGGRGSADIWRAPFTQGGYGAAENLGQPVNSRAGEFEPLIAPDESFLIFAAAGREGGFGAFDLYISWLKEGVWTQPLNLGEGINSSRWDFAPKLSPDGRYFFFASNRSFTDRPLDKRLTYAELIRKLRSPRNGLRDIYQVEASALKLAR
jgi:Tol biopolymer transport system component